MTHSSKRHTHSTPHLDNNEENKCHTQRHSALRGSPGNNVTIQVSTQNLIETYVFGKDGISGQTSWSFKGHFCNLESDHATAVYNHVG